MAHIRITANMVTLARIALLPVPCALLFYGGETSWWAAFFMLTFLGMTDFIDGMMARRDGPTKLGGLIDPVADKIMIVAIALPLGALGLVPVWAVSAVLSRELLVTALRSSVELRGQRIKTSTLAKVKTIFQMGGFGTIFLTLSLDKTQTIFVMIAFAAGFLATWLIFVSQKRRPPFWALPVFGAFAYTAVLRSIFMVDGAVMGQVLMMVAITWVSAVDYLVGSFKIFMRTGIRQSDAVRILWTLTYGVGATFGTAFFPQVVLPVMIGFSFELALGGVDSVVSAEHHYAGVKPFFITSMGALVFTLVWIAGVLEWVPARNVTFAAVAMVLVSAAVFTVVFQRWRRLFVRALD